MKGFVPLYALYGEIDTTSELRFVHMETIALRNRLYDWDIRPHRHEDLHQVIWVEDGCGEVMLDDQVLQPESPVLISIPPPVVHGFRWQPDTKGLILTVAEAFIQDALHHTGEPEITSLLQDSLILSSINPGRSVSRMKHLFADTMNEYKYQRIGRASAISGNILGIFAEIARLKQIELSLERKPESNAQNLFMNFKELVEMHFRDAWRVIDYANAMAMTERSLRRLCVSLIGHGPQHIIHQRLLLEAKRGLLYTGKSIAQIGYELGFQDPTYFSRFFMRIEGESPSSFRSLRRDGLLKS